MRESLIISSPWLDRIQSRGRNPRLLTTFLTQSCSWILISRICFCGGKRNMDQHPEHSAEPIKRRASDFSFCVSLICLGFMIHLGKIQMIESDCMGFIIVTWSIESSLLRSLKGMERGVSRCQSRLSRLTFE